jgi:hypothetical protein
LRFARFPRARGRIRKDFRGRHDGTPDALEGAASMLDLILIVGVIAFFGAAVAYVHACHRL